MRTVTDVILKLPDKFQPDAALGLSVVFQFRIDDSRYFSINIAEQQCQVCEQEHPDPDVTLIMDSQTFIEVIEGDLGGTSAFMSGRLRAEGDLMLATKLTSLFKRH
ncbi:MAG: putative sterol carrier protein [Motiliproteus sp.]|jgi:putative sterol carrier protein